MDIKRRNIVISLMVAMFLAAFEVTVVTTAMPVITKNLNGVNLMSWVFSAYLLTSSVSTPIYGKLSDIYGRKKMLNIGIIIFIIGSSLCGFSKTMLQLIIFRAIQGLGAGSILTITYTIIGDVFDLEERTKIQGWLGTVWGIASLVGPFLGGFLIDYLSWHWIFFINLPFGILSIILLDRNLKEVIESKKPSIDYLGAVLLTTSIVFMLLGVFSKSTSSILTCLLIVIICLIAFYFVEKRCADPLVPFDIFTKTTVLINIISFLISGTLIGFEAYTSIYNQNILSYSATISGLIMAPMSLSWLLSSFVIARLLNKHGEKLIIQISILILLLSSLLSILVKPETPISLLILIISIMGFGFGGVFTLSTIIVQTAVDKRKRGVSTSTNSLIRTLGQTITVSIFGGLINSKINTYFSNLGIEGVNSDNIYSSDAVTSQIKEAFFSGVHSVYLWLVLIFAVCLILSFKIKNSLIKEN